MQMMMKGLPLVILRKIPMMWHLYTLVSSSEKHCTNERHFHNHSWITPSDEKLKLYMNIIIPIWDWAIKSESWGGHDFRLTQHHTRNKILKDMQSHYCHSLKPDNPETIVQDEFSEIMITVLPDHTPGDLFVHPFQAALNSLLLKPELMQQSTFSLPNVHNSFSFINNPRVNTITELHHGSWWADSWRGTNYDLQKNEVLVPIILCTDDISLDSHTRRLSLTIFVFVCMGF